MSTAHELLALHSPETFQGAQALEAAARDLATKTTAANCYDRVWTFHDSSSLTKTRDGYTA